MGAGRGAGILSFSRSLNFSVSSVFFYKFGKIHGFHDCCLGTGYAIGCWAVRKMVLYIACFAYNIIIIISFVVLLNCVYLKL